MLFCIKSVTMCISCLLLSIHLSKGCHIAVVECEYDYVPSEDQPNNTDSSNGGNNTREGYGDFEIVKKNCQVIGTRHRRSTDVELEDFFNGCMSGEMPEMKVFMPTLVDFVMHHTIWYHKTENYHCVSDTVDCWRGLCGYLLRWESKYMSPTKVCIEDYGRSKKRDFPVDNHVQPNMRLPLKRSRFIDDDAFLVSLQSHLSIANTSNNVDWKELIQFYKDEFICSRNFCNCTGISLRGNEKCGENWLTRLASSVKLTSEFREPLIKAAGDELKRARKRRVKEISLLLHRLLFISLKLSNSTSAR